MSRYCKGQPHMHPGGVSFHRHVEEFLNSGKRHNLIELAINLGLLHAKDRAVQVRILSPGELGIEPCAYLQKAPDTTGDPSASAGRLGYLGEYLEQGARA